MAKIKQSVKKQTAIQSALDPLKLHPFRALPF